jgi:hypothetical protein
VIVAELALVDRPHAQLGQIADIPRAAQNALQLQSEFSNIIIIHV